MNFKAVGTSRLFKLFHRYSSHITYIFVLLVLLIPQGSLWACGAVDTWIAFYERGEKHKALFHMLDCADNYIAPSDDIALLPVIMDALKSDRPVAEMASQVFKHFNHLWGARNQPSYAGVFKAITGLDDFVSFSNYRDWMVVTAERGANMRERPSLESRILTSVKYGMQVKVLSKQGEWIEVRPVGPGSVDARFERKIGWIHETLLKPY